MENQAHQEIIYALAIGSLLMLLLAAAIILLSVAHSKRLYKKQLEINQLELKHQQEQLEHFINGTEEERKRLAADLHDDVGTRLASFRMKLSRDLDNIPIKTELDEIIQNVREISHNIMPSSIALFGLDVSVSQLAKSFEVSGKIHFETDIQGTSTLDTNTSLALYRVLQELINNTLRHSNAGNVKINSRSAGNNFELEYSDDGRGMPAIKTQGIGLRSIENRLRMIEGRA
jgi:signal transduction histidine kinase